MMQVRCQRCGWMMTLGRDAIAWALAEAQQHQEAYHALDCPRCRHVIKIQVTELRRRLPADYPLPEIPPPAAKPEPEPKLEPAPEPATPAAPVAEEKPAAESHKVPVPAQIAPAPVTAGTKSEPAAKPVRKKTSNRARPKSATASKPKKEGKPIKSPIKKK
jgi:phage FluMu protein Com